MNIKERIKEICNDNGFTFEISREKKEYFCYLGTYTNAGQEWFVKFNCKNSHDLLTQIDTYLSNYDADYEASLWIGDDGHGTNGAPYHIADIVADMMDGWNKLNKLYKELKKI